MVVTSWDDFAAAAPELAARCWPRLDDPGVVLVGTLTRDGSPRITPVEPMVMEGDIWLGMMPGSAKALDLQRDPRCLVHSIVTDRHGTEGDVKVRGRAVPVTDSDDRERFADAVEAKIDWRPTGDYPLFRIDIESVAHAVVEGVGMAIRFWSRERGETKAYAAS